MVAHAGTPNWDPLASLLHVTGSDRTVQRSSNAHQCCTDKRHAENWQATAGRADVRKPPAAPAPRPKLDPTPFGKSGVSISKNLGRAPSGALSEEVSAEAVSMVLQVQPPTRAENDHFEASHLHIRTVMLHCSAATAGAAERCVCAAARGRQQPAARVVGPLKSRAGGSHDECMMTVAIEERQQALSTWQLPRR